MNPSIRLFLFAFWASVLSCSPAGPSPVGTVRAEAQTLAEAQIPDRVMDRSVRLGRANFLEVQKSGTWSLLPGKNLPQRVIYPDRESSARPLTSFNAASETLWSISTPYEAYVSSDQGTTWKLVFQREKIANLAYVLSFAVNPADPKTMVLGTSFNGWFVTFDAGATWKSMADIASTYFYDNGYHDQYNAFVFSKSNPAVVYACVGKEGDWIYRYNLQTGVGDQIAFPGGGYLKLPEAFETHLEGGQEILEVRTVSAYWRWESAVGKWLKIEDRTDIPRLDEAKKARLVAAKDRHGIYVQAHQAGNDKQLQAHLDFMAKNGLNSIVVDFKNDVGELNYDSQVAFAKKIGAIRPLFDVKKLVQKVHERGFYLMARVVVFKDKKLYRAENNRYALWDSRRNAPWANVETVTAEDGTTSTIQKEYWVDTYSPDVWKYNAEVAVELQSLGIDEIQFDYIRFPSDGPTSQISFRNAVPGMSRIDALESFLKLSRQSVSIPIAVDIYGYNGYFVTDYLGQNVTMLSKYVDVICPMFYPSHFWKPFLWDRDYIERARIIYADGSDHNVMNAGPQALVRPWVQSFLLGGERNFDTPKYTAYLHKQLEGVKSSKASGFLLWNNSNKYYMVTKPLNEYLTTTVVE